MLEISGRFSKAGWVWAAMILASASLSTFACKRETPDTACTEAPNELKPAIVAEQPEFDFGKIKQGAAVEHVYKIKNNGTKDLVIEKTTASCGCVATVATTDPIPPGKEGEIKAVFRTEEKRGMSLKRITVFSNDPKTPRLALTLKGEVVLDVDAVPPSLSFNEVMVGTSSVQTAALHIKEPDRVKITSVTSDDPRFSTKIIPGITKEQSSLEVTFLGSRQEEQASSVLHVAVEGKDAVGLDIPVRAQVVGNLRYPRQFFLMRVGKTFNTRDLNIVSRSKQPFKIKSAIDKDRRIKFHFPKTAAMEILIVASIRDPKISLETSIRGTVQITTSDPLDSTIEIGYTISHRQDASEIRQRVMRAKKDRNGMSLPNDTGDTDFEKKIPII
jgi:hypothetical protein